MKAMVEAVSEVGFGFGFAVGMRHGPEAQGARSVGRCSQAGGGWLRGR